MENLDRRTHSLGNLRFARVVIGFFVPLLLAFNEALEWLAGQHRRRPADSPVAKCWPNFVAECPGPTPSPSTGRVSCSPNAGSTPSPSQCGSNPINKFCSVFGIDRQHPKIIRSLPTRVEPRKPQRSKPTICFIEWRSSCLLQIHHMVDCRPKDSPSVRGRGSVASRVKLATQGPGPTPKIARNGIDLGSLHRYFLSARSRQHEDAGRCRPHLRCSL